MINRRIMLRLCVCIALLGTLGALNLLDTRGEHNVLWSNQLTFSDLPALLDHDNDRHYFSVASPFQLLTLVLTAVLFFAPLSGYRTRQRDSLRARGPPSF
ncbi:MULTISPECIES: hypothetical protein [unclassified Oceanobacter]|jgi:hypothetical protein|uniref:hypothetical protein n=1 Tax=unclassified Oceanobacter TaxID=2620260 RepID=UPI0026E39CFF|nr:MULTISPECIES: hypothetical protein [unclassified Oceanobacter]MDO6682662.1 hypothetical protein [Oceanobacter sp. 5_MG-2023]MDP2548424.1 hypothetical protein [Oceanobacter sp. 4_MG-2023]MDP2609129.1 hypothetical protein [Oceanobacter sp. 1_MG-2023]MDP2612451.1 hypothetical protein [Oceanobacter sp. 2_MG-2023]